MNAPVVSSKTIPSVPDQNGQSVSPRFQTKKAQKTYPRSRSFAVHQFTLYFGAVVVFYRPEML